MLLTYKDISLSFSPLKKLEKQAGKDFTLTGKKNLMILLLIWDRKLWSFIIIELLI